MSTKILSLKDLRSKKPAEVNKYIAQLQSDYAGLTRDILANKQKQTHLLKNTKIAIARAHTVLTSLAKESKEK